jgi:hypothetical protein
MTICRAVSLRRKVAEVSALRRLDDPTKKTSAGHAVRVQMLAADVEEFDGEAF